MLIFLLFFNSELISMVIIINFMSSILFSDEEFFSCYKMMDMNFWMLSLIFILYLMMLSSNINYKFSLNMLLISLFYTLSFSNWISFYILYEMVFILTMFAIILMGYSFERLMASYLMLFYSFLFSSPILMMILMMTKNFFIKQWISLSYFYCYLLVASFMVKFPIFGFHYWLPVAHVEASTIGSMILAGILLKLGGVGLFYTILLLNFSLKFHWLAISLLCVMLMILNLSDLKIMIAYSSIAHMTMTFYILTLGSMVGKMGVLMMMFYHGVLSPLMFWIVGLLSWWKTRSLLVVKLISFSYIFILIIFLVCILNMGFPPFLGFLSEVLMFKSLILNVFVVVIFSLSILLSCYYNIYLYWSFNSFVGSIFKLNAFNLDVFIFLLFVMCLNFY